MAIVLLEKNNIGLIVRGKRNDLHSPGVMEQHADCILSSGEPIGFFGDGGDASSGSSGGFLNFASGSSAGGPSLSLNRVGMNMVGAVADYEKMRKIRPFYVNLALAVKYKIVSTVLLIKVTGEQARLFDQFWKNLKLNPGSFHLLGANCSSHASEAFIAAKLVSGGIPGLDTPDNLYRQIKNKMRSKIQVHSGYIGFEKQTGSKGYTLHVEAVK